MKKGDIACIRMKKTIIAKSDLKEQEFPGNISKYDDNKECIYFLLQSGQLEDLSLDAIYECKIKKDNEVVSCTGRIRERYCGEEGKMLKIQIENGFYKINIKCVDKQNT